ncbi:MAG: hypothetical protein OQJ97_12970 [Rhodospirillales bacterium]|nr:hypothetical protein [Rhodospirillales bacterium]
MSNRYRVETEWKASYQDPIVLNEGEELWLSGKADKWDGHIWVWAKNQVNKEGWIPDTLVRTVAGKHYANMSFSALELTCSLGEELIANDEKHGWVLCQSKDGLEGWVPARNLKAI